MTVYPLRGVVQHYPWGGNSFIPRLLNIENIDGKPFAEYWLGAHPNHPSKIENPASDLSQLIGNQSVNILGETVAKKFSSLPYLFKVLDVRKMLSIQVHPDKASAERGFEDENKKAIPLHAPHRNYKDDNHKPEMMVALSDFWLLHGFKTEEALEQILNAVPEFIFLKETFLSQGYKGLYEKLMFLPQEEVNALLQPLVKRIVPLYASNRLDKSSEDFWAARAVADFCKDDNYDRGIFSIYFFNLVHLKKGEGIYQGAGLPHAYLEGQNIELMANSDNVLRAGLTDKFIDVPELIKHVRFEPTIPKILEQDAQSHRIFYTPAAEFELHQFELHADQEENIETSAPLIVLVMQGSLQLRVLDERIELKKGDAALVIAGTKLSLKASASSIAFGASVPSAKNSSL